MRTKVLFLIANALLFSSVLFAQAKTTFGARAGVNFYALNSKDFEGEKSESSIITGFNAGINAEIPVGIDYYIQPGVLFTTKGGKDKESDNKIVISYVEVPVNFLYKPSLGTGRLIIGLGPYIAFGVNAKAKLSNGDDVDLEFKNEIESTDPPGIYLKRFDAGANFLFGYEWANRFSVQLNAGLGLANINSDDPAIEDDKSSTKNTGFGISLGYRFGK